MIDTWFVAIATFAYLGSLFAVARFGDRRADAGRSVITSTVYALAIAVYCTSWTFYGSVGRATSGGFSFLTIYLGPTIMFLFATVILKMIRVSKRLRLTSIADFIAARYGKSQLLAGLVTVTTRGFNQDGVLVCDFERTILIAKRGFAPDDVKEGA